MLPVFNTLTQLKTGRRARPVKREGNTNYVSVIYNVVIKGFNPKIRVFRIFFISEISQP